MAFVKLKAWLYGAVALIGAVLGAYVLGRAKGASVARVERLESELDDMQEAYDVAHEISGIDRDDIDARLDKWVRD